MSLDRNKIHTIYSALKGNGDYEADYTTFENEFAGNENYKKRKAVYDTLKKGGADVGSTYEEFMQRMQSKQPSAPKQTQSASPSSVSGIPSPQQSEPQHSDPQQTPMAQTPASDSMVQQLSASADRYADGVRLPQASFRDASSLKSPFQRHGEAQIAKSMMPEQPDLKQGQLTMDEKGNAQWQMMDAPASTDTGIVYTADEDGNPQAHIIGQEGSALRLATAEKEAKERRDYYKSLDDRISDLDRRIEQGYQDTYGRDVNARRGSYYGITPTAQASRESILSSEAKDYMAAQNLMKTTKRMQEAAQRYKDNPDALIRFAKDTGISFWNSATDFSTWDFGMQSADEAIRVRKLYGKFAAKGEAALTPSERDLLDAVTLNTAAQMTLGDKQGIGNTVGQTSAEMLPFMIEMLVNPASGVSKEASKATAKAIARYAAKRFLQGSMKKGTAKALSVTGKYGSRFLYDLGAGALMSATTSAPHVVADAERRRTGTLYTDENGNRLTDEDGNVGYQGDSAASAYAKAFGARTIENQSELFGDAFLEPLTSKFGKFILRGIESKAGGRYLGKILTSAQSTARRAANTSVGRSIAKFNKGAHYNGIINEYLEEVVGNFENAATVGDNNFKLTDDEGNISFHEDNSVFNFDDNFATFLAVAVPGIVQGAASHAQYQALSRIAGRGLSRSQDFGFKAFGWEDWLETMQKVDGIDFSDAAAAAAQVKAIIQSDATTEDQACAITRYAQAAAMSQSLEISQQVQEEEETSDLIEAIREERAKGSEIDNHADAHAASREADQAEASLGNIRGGADIKQQIDDILAAGEQGGTALNAMLNGLTPEQRTLAEAYIASQSRINGIEETLLSTIDQKVEDKRAELAPYLSPEGTFATIEIDGQQRHVKGFSEDLSTVYYFDEEGKVQSAPVTEQDINESFSGWQEAEEYLSSYRSEMEEAAYANVNNQLENHPSTVTNLTAGAEYSVPVFRDGEAHMRRYQVISEDPATGSVTVMEMAYKPDAVTNQDGSKSAGWAIAEGASPVTMAKEEAIRRQNEAHDAYDQRQAEQEAEANQQEGEGESAAQPEESAAQSEQDASQSEQDAASANEQAIAPSEDRDASPSGVSGFPSPQQENQQQENQQQSQSFLSRIPLDEQGQPIYEKVDPDTAWDAILEQTEGDADMAQAIAADMVSDKEAALKRAQSAKPRKGATVAEKIAAQKEHKAAIDRAQSDLDHWKQIAATQQRRQEAEDEPIRRGEASEQAENGTGSGEETKGAESAGRKPANAGGTPERQGDLDKNESIKLSDEIDENGRQFVLTSEGKLAFGEIGEDSGLTAAPILLSEGMITNAATNDGYGLVHIEARHGDQIRKAGYKSVVDFIETVAKNYDVIKEGNLRDGHQTYRLQLTDKHNNTLMVELSGDGNYWNINTAGIFKTSYGKKNKEVYSRHTTAKQPVETAETSQDTEQSDTQASSSMNVPTSSSSKDTDISSESQENTKKSTADDGKKSLSAQEAAAAAESIAPEWHEDTPQAARARGYRRQGGHPYRRQEPVPSAKGKEVEVKFADNVKQKAHVTVIDASSLQPSHMNGKRNISFFIDEAQPKERDGQESTAAAEKIASSINPEEITSSVTAYTGAPTVNTRGEVIQGNNRSAALKAMWQNHPEQAEAYKQHLIDHAAEFGLKPEDIASMEAPVLVNMADVTDDRAITLGQYTASDTESGGTERIKAKATAQKMGADMTGFTSRLLRSEDEDETISQLIDANAVETLKWMQRQGYITPTQYRSAFDRKGNLTAEAANDLKSILYETIFQGGSTQLREMFAELPAKAQKAILAIAYRDYDSPASERILPELQRSIIAYHELSHFAPFVKAKGMAELQNAIIMWQRQYQIDESTGESYLPSEKYSNFALQLAAMYKGQTQRLIQSTLSRILDLIQGKQEQDLFSDSTEDNTPRTMAEAIREVLNIEYNGRNGSNVLGSDDAASPARRQGSPRSDKPDQQGTRSQQPADNTGGTGVSDDERGTESGSRKLDNHGRIAERRGKILANMGDKYALSTEQANNGELFIQNENGSTTLAIIPDEIFDRIGIKAVPFKLTETMGWHVYDHHRKEANLNSVSDAVDFVLSIINNVDHVRLGRDNTYIFSVEKNRNRLGRRAITIMVNSKTGEFMGIRTSGYETIKKLKERPLLWERGAHAAPEDVATPTITTIKSQQGDKTTSRAKSQSNGLSADKNSVTKGKLLYRFDGGAQTEHHPADVSVTTSHENKQGLSSASKGTTLPTDKQTSEKEFSEKVTESDPLSRARSMEAERKGEQEPQSPSAQPSGVSDFSSPQSKSGTQTQPRPVSEYEPDEINAFIDSILREHPLIGDDLQEDDCAFDIITWAANHPDAGEDEVKAAAIQIIDEWNETEKERHAKLTREEEAKKKRQEEDEQFTSSLFQATARFKDTDNTEAADAAMSQFLESLSPDRLKNAAERCLYSVIHYKAKDGTEWLPTALKHTASHLKRLGITVKKGRSGLKAGDLIITSEGARTVPVLSIDTENKTVTVFIWNEYSETAYTKTVPLSEVKGYLCESPSAQGLLNRARAMEAEREAAARLAIGIDKVADTPEFGKRLSHHYEVSYVYGTLTRSQIKQLESIAKSLGGTYDWEMDTFNMPTEEAADSMRKAMLTAAASATMEETEEPRSETSPVPEQEPQSPSAQPSGVSDFSSPQSEQANSRREKTETKSAYDGPVHNETVQSHDWSQHKEGDIFEFEGADGKTYRVRFKHVERDEDGYVNGVAVYHLDADGKPTGSESVPPLMFLEMYKPSSDKSSEGPTANPLDRARAMEAERKGKQKQDDLRRRSLREAPVSVLPKATQSVLSKIAKSFGAEVRYLPTDADSNGLYDPETNTIYLVQDANEALSFVFGHELTHMVKSFSQESYDRLLAAAKQALGSQFGTFASKKETLYRSHGYNYGREYYEEEAAADTIGSMIDNGDMARSILRRLTHPVLTRILDALDHVISLFRGEKAKRAARLRKDIEQAIAAAATSSQRQSDGQTRHAFSGEKGATAADRAESSAIRRESLSTAKAMLSEGKDAKAIKLATGWEMGKDGKWRREVPDAAFNAPLKDLLRIINTTSGDERQQALKIANNDYDTLGSSVKADEIFKAYPQLKSIRLIFDDTLPKEEAGHYSEKNNAIVINASDFHPEMQSTLIHELQHAIQRIEGFATGGSVRTAMEYLSSGTFDSKFADISIKKQVAYELSQKHNLGLTKEEVNSLIENLENDSYPEDKLQQQIDDLCAKHGITEDQLEDIYDMDKVWHEAYRRIAGEVEARNVQTRRRMTEDERRSALAADTEDVPRHDQIVLRHSLRESDRALRDALIDHMRSFGMDVITDEKEGQRVLDMANREDVKLSAKKRRALETASVSHSEKHQPTVVSSADGAKILKELDTAKEKYENLSSQSKTFLGDVAKALGAQRQGSASEYATFETKNGKIVTIRLANHNATVSNFDHRGESEGISIVVSPKRSEGITNDGAAHVVEYYYDAIKLRRADGKPLADIVRSIKQALYSGEFTDTTGLAERQEVNAADVVRLQQAYHGSGADHIRFFRTPEGEAYGYTVNGKIYIDPRIATSETPIHEYTHLWATALRKQDPSAWQGIVSSMKGTSLWDEVRASYPELETDDEIADEVLAHYSGKRGSARLTAEMRKLTGENRSDPFAKAAAMQAISRVRNALRTFWEKIASLLHLPMDRAADADTIADTVLSDLLGRVDPRSNGINPSLRKHFIGERGAEKADRTEKAGTRLENLRVARKMETDGKDAKRIKMATGWERGADGKWRYEIQDIKYHPKGDAEYNKLRNKQPWSKELDALEDRLFDGEQLTDDESKRFDELAEEENKFKADFLSREKNRLADWVENKDLFDAYPDLKNVEIVFTDQLPESEGGYYSKKENRLVVNTASDMDTESVIAHEIQHAIQRIEGFARGGSPKSVEREFQKAKAEWKARAYASELEETAKKLGEYYNQAAVEKALIKEYEDMDMSDWLPDKETRIKGFNYFARGYADSSLDDAIKDFRLNESTRADFSPYLEYRKLGGEVESRNVQKRMGMTLEERRASLAAETEDVAREDQTFLFGSDGVDSMGSLIMSAENHSTDADLLMQAEQNPEGTLRHSLRHSLRDEEADLADVNRRFNERLDSLMKDPAQKGRELQLGRPGRFLEDAGLGDSEIVLDYDKIVKKSSESYRNEHPFDIADIKDLPNAINSPIAVFNNTNGHDHGNVILTELQKGGNNFIVAVRAVERRKKGGVVLEVNEIKSLFPKEARGIVNWLNTNKASNINKEKALAWLGALRNHRGTELTEQELSDAAKVVENFESTKVSGEKADENQKFRLLDDSDPMAKELESLPDDELVPVYRNVQAFGDDALGSPMAFFDAETGERRTLQGRRWNYSEAPKVELTDEQQHKLDELNKNGYLMVNGKQTTELPISDGLKFVKPKTKEAQLQYLLKKDPEDDGIWAAYDPYDHAIETPLNTQFGTAYKRPNLVVVRSLIPKSEITEPFHADYALLPTGAHQWNNGRTLYLSRWSKIDKVLSREEEAKLIDEYWKKNPSKREALKTHRDYNRFVPEVRKELEKMGYRFEYKGKPLTPEESLALDKQQEADIIPGAEGRVPYITGEDIERINAKMSGKWVGEPKESMENEMAARVEDLSKKLGTPVRIIRTEEEMASLPTQRQRRQKGSFNTQTGEVTIVVPNNANLADIENTFIHEVVGHDGLRVLFPTEEKLNNALDELYRVSNDSIKHTIDRMAQRMYDAEVDRLREQKRKAHEANGEDALAHYDADMAEAHAEASKKREQFRRDATEEYGADLAGRIGESGFERMSAEELTFWGKVKATLQKALTQLLNGLSIPSSKKWTDKEWAYVLHESYKRKKNGGQPSVSDRADTMMMERKTGYGKSMNSDNGVMFRDGPDDGPLARAQRMVKESRQRKANRLIKQYTAPSPISTSPLDRAARMAAQAFRERSERDPAVQHIAERVDPSAPAATRYSLRGVDTDEPALQVSASYDAACASRLFALDEAWHDYLASVRTAVELISKQLGRQIPEWANPYMHALIKSSKDSAEYEDCMRHYLIPLQDAVQKLMRSSRMTLKEVEFYLMAKHGLERNEVMHKRNAEEAARKKYAPQRMVIEKEHRSGKMSEADYKSNIQALDQKEQADYAANMSDGAKKYHKDYAGFTQMFSEDEAERETITIQDLTSRAEAHVKRIEQQCDAALLDGVWQRIKAANDYSLKRNLDSGLISQETFGSISQMYEHYVPLRGHEDTEASEVYDYFMDGEPVRINSVVKKASGRKSQAGHVLANIMSMCNSAIVQANKNELKQKLYNLATVYPSDLLGVSRVWYVCKYENGQPTDEWIPAHPSEAKLAAATTAAERQQVYEEFEQEMQNLKGLDEAREGKSDLDLRYPLDAALKRQHVLAQNVSVECLPSVVTSRQCRARQP